MATKTKAELIFAALEELKVLGEGQTPSAEQTAIVERRVGPVVADLAARRKFYLADVEEIDESVFVHIAVCLARACANAFAIAGAELRDLVALAKDAEDLLETISAGESSRATLKLDRALSWR